MSSKSVRKREPNWAMELLKERGIRDINGILGFSQGIDRRPDSKCIKCQARGRAWLF